jgi:uncharacterized protein (DUF433 family)
LVERRYIIQQEGERKVQVHRITVDPEIHHGKPCIKGTRIPVYLILEMLEYGYSFSQIMEEYPSVSVEEIKACIAYAKDLVEHVVSPSNVHHQISSR